MKRLALTAAVLALAACSGSKTETVDTAALAAPATTPAPATMDSAAMKMDSAAMKMDSTAMKMDSATTKAP
jgi:hypothetical protein